MNKNLIKFFTGIFISCLFAMLWAYQSGYSHSIDWSVISTGDLIEFPTWTLDTDLMTHEIQGEKYLLSEQYAGSEIKRNLTYDQIFLGLMWAGLCLALVASTYLKRYAFFVFIALFTLFLNRLNLFEVGLFGIQTRWVVLIPSIILLTPLIIFHEYKKSIRLLPRLIILLTLSIFLLLGIDNSSLFTDHMIAHSLFGFVICSLIFLFIISEELIFGILYVVTSGKGGKNNHLHFLILSCIYLGNLLLHYLNKSGLYENNFFFFDPFILLTISCLVSLWSLKFKSSFLAPYLNQSTLSLLFLSFGIITLSFLTHQMMSGNDAVYQAFHAFILYFHIGFSALFILYIIGNFIDPLSDGIGVYEVVYKEENFPYVSARFGGFVTIVAFYLLSGQEPYNLLKAGYYNYLAQTAKTEQNYLLAREYSLYAKNLGYNTHYANYSLGWNEMSKGTDYPAKNYFFNATQRFPSSYALINYGNLDAKTNANKVQATYEEFLRHQTSGEVENNLGILYMEKGDLKKALSYFEKASPLNKWNDAPLINKWNVFSKVGGMDSNMITDDYATGNFGVKNNILTTQSASTSLAFQYDGLLKANYLHRQTYLLNSSYLFDHDSIENLVRKEIETSIDGAYNDRLRKALAIHLYKKGKVNASFMMLNYLQANAHQYDKGQYLDALGKLSLDQQAYRLSLESFDKALNLKYTKSFFSCLEVLVRMGNKDQVPNELLNALKKNPELTTSSNSFLGKLEKYQEPEIKKREIPILNSLSEHDLIALGRMNAFHTAQVIAVVDELASRNSSGGYELLIDAIEINPYNVQLLKKYALTALDWNLVVYAEQTLDTLKGLLSPSAYQAFIVIYQKSKEEIENTTW